MPNPDQTKKIVFAIYNTTSSRLPLFGVRAEPLRGREKTVSKLTDSSARKAIRKPAAEFDEDQVTQIIQLARRRAVRVALRYGSHVNDVQFLAWNKIRAWWDKAQENQADTEGSQETVVQEPAAVAPAPRAPVPPPVPAVAPPPPIVTKPQTPALALEVVPAPDTQERIDAPEASADPTSQEKVEDSSDDVTASDAQAATPEQAPSESEDSVILSEQEVHSVPEDLKVKDGADISVIDWDSLSDPDSANRNVLRSWGKLFEPPIKGSSKKELAGELLAAKEKLGL